MSDRPRYVPAGPARAHLLALREEYPASLNAYADAAGVALATATDLASGALRNVAVATEQRILALTTGQVERSVRETGIARGSVPGHIAAAHVRTLLREPGVTLTAIAEVSGVNRIVVKRISEGQPLVWLRIEAALLAVTADAARAQETGKTDVAEVVAHLATLIPVAETGRQAWDKYVSAASGVSESNLRRLRRGDARTCEARVRASIMSTSPDDVRRCVEYADAKARPDDRIDATEVREHLTALVAAGATACAIARAAGVSGTAALRVLDGAPTMRRRAAEALLAVDRVQALRETTTLPTAPALAHLAKIMAEVPGSNVNQVARAAGVHVRSVQDLLDGQQRVKRALLSKVLTLTVEDLRAAAAYVEAHEAVWLVRTMQALGYTLRWQAKRLGYAKATAPTFLYAPGGRVTNHVSADLYQRLLTMHREIGDRVATPESTGVPQYLIDRTIKAANDAGYFPPAAYDDDRYLLPDALRTPEQEAEDARIELEEQMDRLLDAVEGFTAPEIAGRLGVDVGVVRRYRDTRFMRNKRARLRAAETSDGQPSMGEAA